MAITPPKQTRKAIVIAGGPSLYAEKVLDVILENLNQFQQNPDITILTTDRTLKLILEKGITPEKFPSFFVCTQEKLRDGNLDMLPIFYYHGIVRKHAKNIILFYAHRVEKDNVEKLKAVGFNMIQFTRFGKGRGSGELIDTCGNCGMALVEIARHILKIEEIGIIGIDLNYDKVYDYDFKVELSHSKKRAFQDFLDLGNPIYNLTEKGLFHGSGIIDMNIEEFLGPGTGNNTAELQLRSRKWKKRVTELDLPQS